jgi:hypothetical protein
MDEYNLDYLKGFQDFQNSDVNTKLGWLDNFSNSMFQAGNLAEARKAQDYRAQLEVDTLSSTPQAQLMGGVMNAIGGQNDLKLYIGTEAYDRINKGYSDRVGALESPADILEVNPGEYVYTRPNPFGDGALVEYDGGSKFVGAANPRSIKALIDTEKLPTIKKDEVFNSLVDKLTPTFSSGGAVAGIETADQLINDPSFQGLPLVDQRSLVRQFRLNRNSFLDPKGVGQADALLSSLDREYNAQQASGAFAPENAPDEFPDTGVAGQSMLALQANKQEWFTSAIDRGTQRWMNQWDLKAAQNSLKESDRLYGTFTPEQREALKDENLLSQITEGSQWGVIPAANIGAVRGMLQGTPLENANASDVTRYAYAIKGYQKANENFVLRGKALTLIPQTKGMADLQDVQAQLAQSDAGWQYKAAITAGAIASHPLDVIANASLESFVSQPLSTAATAALFAIPGGQTPAVALATNLLRGTGTGLVSAIADSSYTYTEELNKARFNQDGTERPLADVLHDPMAMKEVNDNAFLHGVSVGTVEGVTGFLLPGIMSPLDRNLAKGAYVAAGRNQPLGLAAKSILFNAAEMGVQATSEGGGELLGEVAQSKDPDIGSVLMEAAAGLAGPDFFAMYQAPEHLHEAVRQISTTEAAFALSQEMLRKSEQVDADYAATTDEAPVSPTKGLYAQGKIPMVEMGTPDAMGMADFHAFYEEDALEGEAPPIATTTQGLENTNAIQEQSPTGEVLRDEEARPSQGMELQGVVQENGPEVTSQAEAEPIESPGQVHEGQTVSYINEAGSVVSGPVEFGDMGQFLINGKAESWRPGKFFSGVVQPKNNSTQAELGDVVFTGNAFYKSIGDGRFVHGHKTQDNTIQFEDSEVSALPDSVLNDPRSDLYSKPDFDAAQQEYNGRPDLKDGAKFTDILKRTPQKQEPASAPTPPPPAEPVTEEGQTKKTGPTPEEQAVTDIQAPPITKRRTTLFKLRAHKDTGELLGKAVERMNDWMTKTKVFDKSKDQITYAKDGKIQQLFRSQAPESFDETVNQLTKEDQDFRNHKDPTNWTEVPHYRAMERVLQERVNKTASSKSKNKRQSGILKAAQVSSILQALFIQDRAIAAWVSKRFNLYTPNASLITVEDVAQLRYGKVSDWELTGAFGRKNKAGEIIAAPNSYDPMARLIQLTGNANVTDVFHELYHDFLNTIAPVILDNAEYVRLQQFLESRLAQKPFREYLKKRYKNDEGEAFKDEDFTFFNKAGNISVAAHEAFAQMMTRWHHDGKAVRGMAQEDQSVLDTITNFYAQTFQDLNRTPIATTTDDAHDLLSNFFLTPPLLRREAFKPENRIERINEEILAEELSLQELSEGIADATREIVLPEEQTLPAPAQIIGDKLVETYKPGQQPRDGVPFTSAGRSYVIEGDQLYEIIEGPEGPQKVARAIEDKPWDGQTVYPQVKNTNYSAGTQEVSDENLTQTAPATAAKKPVIKTVIPVPETNSTRTILTDPDTGMVISDKTRKKGAKKSTKKWAPPTPPKKGPDNGFRLYSIEDDAEYKKGRMNVRINSDEFSTSNALKGIAKDEGSYRNAPTHAIIAAVEARMNSKVTILDALRDIYKLRRMGPDQRARQFDPENKYEGIGNAGVIYYLLALQSRLDQLATAQDNGLDLDIDRNAALMLMRDVTRAVAVEQREAGRAVNINKHLLTYSPESVIIRLQSDLIRNNKAFLNYVKKAQSFRAKYRQAQLTDSQFAIALKQEGFPEFMAPALRFYSKEEKASLRDFEKEAAVAWAREPNLSGHIRPESEANLRLLSNAANNTSSTWLRDLYAQTAKLAAEAERGQGMIDGWNALFYNNILMSPGVAMVNVVGTAVRIPLDFLAYDQAKNGLDLLEGKAEFLKNEKAMLAGLNQAFRSLPEALTEFAAIAFSGQRGASVEAFTRAQGAIASTQTMLFARPGTWFRQKTPLTFVARLMKILLFDSGRRVATVFDAFYKVFSENTILGAELYREAWDMYQAKPEGKKDQFIASYIDQKLNVKPLAFYQAQADQEILKNGALLIENSTTILPTKAELAVLKNIIAFNLRREAREQVINPQSVDESKRLAFGTSYSNEPKGASKVLADTLNKFATVFGLSKFLGQISKTNILQIGGQKVEGAEYRQGGIEIRTRLSAGGAIAPEISPFSGNVARMAEEFFNWTGLGTVNQLGTNYRAVHDGKTKTFFENNPDTYTKTEIASSMVKGSLGTAVIVSIIASMGGDEEDDDKKHRGLTGFSDRSVFGRNGKETFIPAFSFWWRTGKGDINYLNFKDHPQLVATLGTAASYNERRLQNPDAPWFMMFDRISKAMWAGASESGTFDGLLSIADFLKEAQNPNEKDELDMKKGLTASLAKYVKAHAVPLNRFQKETMAYSILPGRGGEELMPDKEFFPTLYANTLLEGWLSPEDAKHLDRIIKPDGSFKKPNVLSRLGGLTIGDVDLGDVIKAPSPGLIWMRENRYFINKTDYQRPISSYFTKEKQKEQAEAEFSQMNNGMFFVKHASEIEAKAQQYYWPWIAAYSNNKERKAEIDAFVNSETNQLKRRQGSSGYKTERDIQQADINSIVTQARSIGALQASADYYTDNFRVKLWSTTIAIRKIQEGPKLDGLKTNALLEKQKR